jgi:probable O-glycosylation ligase (exosortase A-associated)
MTLRDPKFGIRAFIVILLLDPASLLWGFDQWHIPLVTSIAALVSTLIHAGDRNKNPGGGAIFFWLMILFVFLVLSTVDSVSVDRSLPILRDYWIKLFIFCWLLMIWTKNENDLRLIFTVLVGSFVFLVLRAIYRYSVGWPELGGLAGTMQDRNDFALNLMMMAPIAYAMAETAKTRLSKWYYRIATILLFACVMLTFSRMGFLLMLLAGLMLLRLARHTSQILKIVAPVVLVFLVVLPATYVERMQSIGDYEEDRSAMGRIEAWDAGLEMWRDNPLTGVGLKCFELPEVYLRYATGIPHVAHNAYIQLLSEAGAGALLAWLFLMLAGILGARALARTNISYDQQQYAKAISYAVVLYLVGSVFLNAAYFELPYFLLAGYVALRKMQRQSQNEEEEMYSADLQDDPSVSGSPGNA